MNQADTVKLLELLSSKICHDLISPIGAISNGLEILEEMGGEPDEDVNNLISFSAAQASAKLKAMRLAYGLGGSDPSIKIEDVHKTFGDFIQGESRLQQNWAAHSDITMPSYDGLPKILLCCLMLAAEGLPRGGTIEAKSEDDQTILITAKGENAHFRAGITDALQQSISYSELTPKLVHSYITGLIAQNYNFRIHTDETKESIIFLRLKSSTVS